MKTKKLEQIGNLSRDSPPNFETYKYKQEKIFLRVVGRAVYRGSAHPLTKLKNPR